MKIKTPKPADVNNKVVIVRVDYNVPLQEKNGKITVVDDRRVRNSLDTVNFLLENQAKVILISHLGRPEGISLSENIDNDSKNKFSDKNKKLSLEPVAKHMKKEFTLNVEFVADCVGSSVKEAVNNLQPGQALLLENLRFYKEEKENDKNFAKELANLAQLYINEAFSNSHRSHASMVGIPNYLPTFAGFALEKEIKNLKKLITNPKKPFVMVIGGAKISDKVEAVTNLNKIADVVLVGGGVANNFLKAEGIEVHKSFLQDTPADLKKQDIDYIQVADDLIEDNRTEKILKDGYIPLPKLIYPIDVIAAKNLESTKTQTIELVRNVKDTDDDKDLMYLDIGPKTIRLFQEIILQAGTVFWNGPMGVFEKPQFEEGTKEIARAIAKTGATTILGGGDTLGAIDKFGLEERFDYVSAAGGAALDFLAGKELPGLEALE